MNSWNLFLLGGGEAVLYSPACVNVSTSNKKLCKLCICSSINTKTQSFQCVLAFTGLYSCVISTCWVDVFASALCDFNRLAVAEPNTSLWGCYYNCCEVRFVHGVGWLILNRNPRDCDRSRLLRNNASCPECTVKASAKDH